MKIMLDFIKYPPYIKVRNKGIKHELQKTSKI